APDCFRGMEWTRCACRPCPGRCPVLPPCRRTGCARARVGLHFARIPAFFASREGLSAAYALSEESIVPIGKVKWFTKTKGYGFIQPEDGSKDVFVHISAVERAGLGTLAENQKVQFEIVRGKDGKSSADQLKPA